MAIKQIGSLREYYRQGDNTGAPASPVGMGHAQAIQPVEGFAGSVLGRLPEMGRLVEPLARGYREAQTERVDNELLRVEREFTEWKDEWQTKNQGADARDAAAAFTAKHEELGKAALERMDDIGDHEIFKDLLTKRLNHQNLYALRDGLSYAGVKARLFPRGNGRDSWALSKEWPKSTPRITRPWLLKPITPLLHMPPKIRARI